VIWVLLYRAKGPARRDAERLADQIIAPATSQESSLRRSAFRPGPAPSLIGHPWPARPTRRCS
jgi:hypothetical protein